MGNSIDTGDPWETISFHDNEMHYFRKPSSYATPHLLCDQFCFNPQCKHHKMSQESLIRNEYYTDHNGNIVGYDFEYDGDVSIPKQINV